MFTVVRFERVALLCPERGDGSVSCSGFFADSLPAAPLILRHDAASADAPTGTLATSMSAEDLSKTAVFVELSWRLRESAGRAVRGL